MKKLIYCALALAAGFFVASCQQENLEPVAQENSVTYTVEVPGVDTKAIGDGQNVDQLVYEVWKTGEDGVITDKSTRLYQKTINLAPDAPRKWIVTLNLVQNQTYKALFWAQVGKPKGHENYNTDQLTNVYYAYDVTKDYSSNQESYAAFYGTDVLDTHTPLKGKTITLTRPFAQLNIGTLNTALEDEYAIDMLQSSVEVTVPTQFNVATSEVANTQKISFALADVPSDPNVLPVSGKNYDYAAMNYVFAGENTTSSVEYTIETEITPTGSTSKTSAVINKTIPNVPLKENYRTNIVGNLLTSSANYEVVIDADWADGNEPDGGYVVDVTNVSTDEEFEKALRQDLEHIVIELGSSQTKSAQPAVYSAVVNGTPFGTANTKSITIKANGNTINFVYTNGDSQSVKCVNEDCKIYIEDAVLTNSGKNNGPWNRHDICFNSAVGLSNVISDKAIALYNDATLTNVTISDVHPDNNEVYGLWITPLGQTIDLDRVTITPSADKKTDRAIKIDEQYFTTTAAPVTLNIKNSTFISQKKAAVTVKTKVGSTINWGEGNNIERVTEDPVNPVWVDKGMADYFDLVIVNGGTKVLEGAMKSVLVYNSEELQNAVNNAAEGTSEIAFGANIEGDVTIRQKVGVNLIINGLDKKFDGTFFLEGGNQGGTSPETLTFHNINFEHLADDGLDFISCDDAKTIGKRYAHNVTVDNCTFTGNGGENVVAMRYRQCNDMTVTNTTASGLHSLMWATGGTGNISIDNVSVLNSYNGASFGTSSNVTVNKFTVNSKGQYGYGLRAKASGAYKMIVTNSNITADAPILLRETTSAAYELTLSGNTLTTSKDYQLIVCAKDYEEGETLEEPAVECNITGAEGLTSFPIRTIHEPSGLIWNGSNAKKFWITNAEQLFKAAKYFNGFTHTNEANVVTLELTADIDLANQDWKPWNVMWITLNGNNHTISNLNVPTAWRSGFFAYAGGVKVNDLTIENATVSGAQAGVLAGAGEGLSTDNVKIAGDNFVTYTPYSSAEYTETYGGIGVFTGMFASSTVNGEILPSATVTLNYNDIVTNASYLNKLIGYTAGNYSNNGTITNSGSVESVGEINSQGVSYVFDYNASTLNIESKAEYGNTVYRGWISDGSNYGITNIVVSEGITRLNNRAFCKNTQLKTVSLPNTLTYIDESVFQQSGFTSITIPENVTYIGKTAFGACPALETIIINAKDVEIEDYCARGCPNLKSVYIYSDEITFAKPGSMYFTNLESDNTSSITYYVASQAIADAVKASIATGHAKGAVIKNIDGTQTYYTIQ